MEGQRLGPALRAIRIRRGLTQREVAALAHVSESTHSRIERGHIASLSVGCVLRVAAVLDVRVDLVPRWRGGDLARLLDSGHAALVELVMLRFSRFAGWEAVPEVSFSVYGERGSIDVLAWFPATCTVLIVEVKSVIVDIQDLVGTADRKRRLAAVIARERGWDPQHVGVWVAVADTRTNHRRLAEHRATLRAAFPGDGFAVDRWLRDPASRLDALSFLPDLHGRKERRTPATARRVRTASTTGA